MINLKNVTKIFLNGNNPQYALNHVTFSIQEQEFIGIIGKSGSGKSTLLNIMSGVDSPSYGTVIINGTEISSLSNRQMTKWRSKNIGFVFQSFHLIPTLTLLENIILPMEFAFPFKKKQKEKRAMDLLDSVGLADKRNLFPEYASGGEKQRVAIARALANNPPLILADEPTGNLDSENANLIFSLFKQLVKDGKTIVMVTHDLDLANQVNRTLRVKDGEVISNVTLDLKEELKIR
ncbi:ABC transporter ATP-binding protein [Fredinandcohnia onubensis]|uniref:ABC transporter ATP-binding protein n=1 Tax=Fredinandcohnia onubensis TaxID=1571209 RepID=UPI000C0BCF1D|nr:ABC transporter ATP-binding protein [Fredinandcohnia onubensis]